MFWADPIQKSNPNMYADVAMSSAATMAFYVKNGLIPPSSAQILAAVAKDSDARKALLNSTNMAGLASALLVAPPAVSWCLSNPILCNRVLASSAEIADGDALGPMGLGVAGWAGVNAVKTAEEVNAAMKAANLNPAWSSGTAVVEGSIAAGTKMRMVIDEAQLGAVSAGDFSKLGRWATFDDLASVAIDMRQRLAIVEAFKPTGKGPFYAIEIEVIKTVASRIGYVGSQAGAGGGATQVNFLVEWNEVAKYLRAVGDPITLK